MAFNEVLALLTGLCRIVQNVTNPVDVVGNVGSTNRYKTQRQEDKSRDSLQFEISSSAPPGYEQLIPIKPSRVNGFVIPTLQLFRRNSLYHTHMHADRSSAFIRADAIHSSANGSTYCPCLSPARLGPRKMMCCFNDAHGSTCDIVNRHLTMTLHRLRQLADELNGSCRRILRIHIHRHSCSSQIG